MAAPRGGKGAGGDERAGESRAEILPTAQLSRPTQRNAVLTCPPAYMMAYLKCDVWLTDCDGDRLVNALDIDPFVLLLTDGG
jgi:hypothetical protein